jgi:SAM-dependent methyltransferase
MLILSRVGTKARNGLRRVLQAYGTENIKRRMWDVEFSRGRWNCLDATPGDCVYPCVEKYANNGRVLDLGCGSGSTGNELDAATYQHYTGVDISEVAIEKARQRTDANGRGDKSRYVQSDIFSYVPDQTFDVILFRDSIYYIPRGRITSMLDRYSKHLRDTGVFIVRIASRSDKYQPIVDRIERHFDVVEERVSDQPEALVIVFRPHRHAHPTDFKE